MTEADQVALDIMREKLERMLPDSPVMAGEVMLREKEAARLSDWNRIARGEATPEQIQRENSPFTVEIVRTFKITNLEQVLAELE